VLCRVGLTFLINHLVQTLVTDCLIAVLKTVVVLDDADIIF